MAATTSRKGYILSIATLGALFFVFGLVSWVNSILVPYFKVSCELHSEAQSYLANFAFYISYLVMSIPSSVLLNKVGFRRACRYGLWVLAFGALLFVPAAMTRQYWLFLVALFTMGTSLSILQTTANPAVTVIGPLESASRRISIMGVCNKFAGIIAPLLFAALVIHPGDEAVMAAVQDGSLVGAAKDAALGSLIRNVIPPYIGLAVILFLFSLIFYRPVIPDINPSKENAAGAGEGAAGAGAGSGGASAGASWGASSSSAAGTMPVSGRGTATSVSAGPSSRLPDTSTVATSQLDRTRTTARIRTWIRTSAGTIRSIRCLFIPDCPVPARCARWIPAPSGRRRRRSPRRPGPPRPGRIPDAGAIARRPP